MRICHIITAFGYGGAEKLLVDLVNIQLKNHEVHIVYLKDEPLLLPLITGTVQLHKVNLDIRCAHNLRKFIKILNPDIIHTQLGHADLIGLWASRNLKAKQFCTMQNIWFKWNWMDYLIFFIYSIIFNTVAKNCKVIAISKSVFSHVEKVLKVPNSRIILMHNSIPTVVVEKSKEKIREELYIPSDAFCVLFVGRLALQKSVETLLYATKELEGKIENLQILIVGTGVLKDKLENLTKELEISEVVVFAGNSNEVEKYFASADVFVLPSVFEGLGMVILEAFRASLLTIATNVEGPKELIKDGYNGLLFEPKDHKKLAEHILQIYRNPELRKKIGENGYRSYDNKYDIITYAKQLEALYLQ